MPASETPTNPPIPAPPEADQDVKTERGFASDSGRADINLRDENDTEDESSRKDVVGRSSSRYVDYDSHELLERISQYEDERRWARIREGIWISIIAHALFFSLLSWIPKYIFHQPILIDPSDAIKQRKDLTYLDELPDAVKQLQKAKPKVPALKPNDSQVDKKTLDALKSLQKAAPKPAPSPKVVEQTETSPAATPPPATAALPPTPQPAPPSTAAPKENPQIALDSPRPAPVPAKPNFSIPQQSAEDQLRQAMRDSAHAPSSGGAIGGSLGQHPGAGGGAQILSDTQGVDFGPYMQKVIRETYRTWDPLIPEEVNPPILKRGQVEVVFTILPNGRLQPHAMLLTGRSGDVALDRAAWGAIEGADYPPLPREFHGPYLQLRFRFQYNVR